MFQCPRGHGQLGCFTTTLIATPRDPWVLQGHHFNSSDNLPKAAMAVSHLEARQLPQSVTRLRASWGHVCAKDMHAMTTAVCTRASGQPCQKQQTTKTANAPLEREVLP